MVAALKLRHMILKLELDYQLRPCVSAFWVVVLFVSFMHCPLVLLLGVCFRFPGFCRSASGSMKYVSTEKWP
ncbi:hypothetical protein NL676_013319 [Syzygium grande]|nr:hypothetical protein NL676_013319 [Syzygium grande]